MQNQQNLKIKQELVLIYGVKYGNSLKRLEVTIKNLMKMVLI